VGEKLFATARTLESELVHNFELDRLRDLTTIHIESVFRITPTFLQFIFIVIPLIGNNIITAETPDRNNHFGGIFLWTVV
jgi:hypothetical protein